MSAAPCPKVSVIIPAYNTVEYLDSCLVSVCAQTLQDMEIICINDASTDGSLHILQKYAQIEPRLKIIDLSTNVGNAVARNLGLEMARGEYLGFVDSDDTVAPDFFQTLYENAAVTDADISRGYIREISIDGQIRDDKYKLAKIKAHKAHFLQVFWAAIYKNNFIKKWNIKFEPLSSRSADVAYVLRAVAACNFVSTSDQSCYNYLRRENSLDSNDLALNKIIDSFHAYDAVIEFLHTNLCDDFTYNMQIVFIISECMTHTYRAFRHEYHTATNSAANYIIKVYEQCRNKESLANFIRNDSNLQSRIVRNILPAMQDGNSKEIEKILIHFYRIAHLPRK